MSLLKALVLVGGAVQQLPAGDTVADWNTLANRPATFPPSVHSHAIADVTNLQTSLDAKLNTSAYTAADVLAKLLTVDTDTSGLNADTLDSQQGTFYLARANHTGTQAISTVTGLQTALDSKIPDAPSDGTIYGRQNAAWVPAGGGGGGIPEAPTDSGYYVRRNSAWVSGDTRWLQSTVYTAADVLAKLLTVDGVGSGLDADLLDGQSGSFYQNAGNLNAGTLPDARLTGAYTGLTSLTLSANLFMSGGGFIRSTTIDSADNSFIGIAGGGDLASARGAAILVYGNEAAGNPGNLLLTSGTAGQIKLNGAAISAFATSTDLVNATGTLDVARLDDGSVSFIKLQHVNQFRMYGRIAAGFGEVKGLDAVEIKGMLGITTSDVSGLGTAAGYNIGTSGATVPLLNAGNTWGTTQFFGAIQMSGNLAATGSGFEIVTSSVDGADNKYLLLSSTSSSGSATRGAYVQMWGNESANPGRLALFAGSTSTLNLLVGGAAPNTSLRIYNGTSVGADSGNILICAGGDVGPTRGAYIAMYGVDTGTSAAGDLDLRAGTGGQILFNNAPMSAFATSTDLANSTGVLPNARLSGSYSAVTAMTFSSYWQVQPAAAHVQCYMDIPTGNYVADIFARKGSVNRWILRLGDNDTESGADSGTNFRLYRCNDAGSATQVLRIARNNGAFEFAVAPTVGGSSRWGDADLLDGQHGAYYSDLANSTGVLSVSRGGTGQTTNANVRAQFNVPYVLFGSTTWDPPSIAAGSQTSTTITVTGATTTDVALVNVTGTGAGVAITHRVTGANTVTVWLHNISSSPLDFGSITAYAIIFRNA